MTCQYPEGFRWLTSHPKPRVGKLKRDKFGKERSDFNVVFRGSKSIKNRYRFCTVSLVGLEEEIIDKDFRQSYWLALQFWVQPNRIFTVGVPQASHGIKLVRFAHCGRIRQVIPSLLKTLINWLFVSGDIDTIPQQVT